MKNVIATIIGIALVLALIIGVIVPLAQDAEARGDASEQQISTINTDISSLGTAD